MKPKDCVEVQWEVGDGYVGASRPQFTYVPYDDFDSDDDADIEEIIMGYVQEDFDNNVSFDISNLDEAIRVAKASIKRRS